MPRRFATHILFAFVAVSLALPAPRAFAQAPSRAAIASEDLSASLQSVTRQVEPAVVEIFTTSYAARDGVVPSTGRSGDDAARVRLRRHRRSGRLHRHQRARGPRHAAAARRVARSGRRAARFSRRAAEPSARNSSGSISRPISPSSRLTSATCRRWRLAIPRSCEPGRSSLAFGSPLGLHNSASLGIVARSRASSSPSRR